TAPHASHAANTWATLYTGTCSGVRLERRPESADVALELGVPPCSAAAASAEVAPASVGVRGLAAQEAADAGGAVLGLPDELERLERRAAAAGGEHRAEERQRVAVAAAVA